MRKVIIIGSLILLGCIISVSVNFSSAKFKLTMDNIESLAFYEDDDEEDDRSPYKHGHFGEEGEKCTVTVEGKTLEGHWYDCKWHPDDPPCKRTCVTAIYFV